jgi:hypothetical protein
MFEGVRETIADPATGTLLEVRLPDGRSRVLRDRIGRESLLRAVFEPLLGRYGRSGERSDLGTQILAVEFMNEPDFVVEEWERDLSLACPRPLPFAVLAELVTRLNEMVHTHTGALTTIGCARLHNLWAWDDPALELDFLQLHSYPDLKHPERDADVFGKPVAMLGMRKRVVLGEFPATAPRAILRRVASRTNARASISSLRWPRGMQARGRGASAAPMTTDPCPRRRSSSSPGGTRHS